MMKNSAHVSHSVSEWFPPPEVVSGRWHCKPWGHHWPMSQRPRARVHLARGPGCWYYSQSQIPNICRIMKHDKVHNGENCKYDIMTNWLENACWTLCPTCIFEPVSLDHFLTVLTNDNYLYLHCILSSFIGRPKSTDGKPLWNYNGGNSPKHNCVTGGQAVKWRTLVRSPLWYLGRWWHGFRSWTCRRRHLPRFRWNQFCQRPRNLQVEKI